MKLTSIHPACCRSIQINTCCVRQTTNQSSQNMDEQFDVVFNCNPTPVVGKSAWNLARGSCLKPDGRFVAVTADDPNLEVHTVWDMLKLMPSLMFRPMTNKLRPWSPDYVNSLGRTSAVELGQALELIAQGKVKVIMDNNSPHAFNTEGVRAAFLAVDGKHAHGKVVVDLERT
jgi:NADPH:quinone reductase-like Zn-dependent oxidoreductase